MDKLLMSATGKVYSTREWTARTDETTSIALKPILDSVRPDTPCKQIAPYEF